MRARLLIVSVLFAAAAGAAHTQPPPQLPGPPVVPPAGVVPDVPPGVVSPPTPQPLPPAATSPSADKSLERMLDQLESLRTRKADLERQEKELMTDIRKLLDKQDERVKRLGVVQVPAPVIVPTAPLVVPSGAGLPPFPLPSVPVPKKG